MSTDLNSGDVLFHGCFIQAAPMNPTEIAYISLPKDEFDWHAFTNSGNIKVKAGSKTAGYLLRLRLHAPSFSAGTGVGVPSEGIRSFQA